ncbi:MAG: hypothetical protein V1689_00050 [Pseudomonadota bacterium]
MRAKDSKQKMIPGIPLKRGARLLVVFPLFCLLFFWPPFLRAETKGELEQSEVLAIGTGAIHEGNMALAKKNAISNALIKGVEDYLMRRLGSHGVINNFERLVQGVIPKAREEIQNFNILAEGKIGDEYKVLVRLRINEEVIDQRLRQTGLIHAEGPPIKVLFLVSEASEERVSCWWNDPENNPALSPTELALYKAFQERGFIPINRTLTTPETEYFKELRSPELEDEDIFILGRLFSADVVIYGQSETADPKGVALRLKAFDVDKGRQVCENSQAQELESDLRGAEGMSVTLERLVNRVAGELAPAVIKVLTADSTKVHRLAITVRGLKTLRQVKEIRDFLRSEVKGVESVRLSRIKKNSISFDVESRGDKKRFLDSILNHKKLPFKLSPVRTEDGDIVLTVV